MVLSSNVKFAGTVSEDTQCQEIARGALALYGLDQAEQAKKLLALLTSKDHFSNALIAIIRAHFGDGSWGPQEL